MESFYGGRQGVSFIIVKSFDGINIPQDENNPTYNFRLFAYDEDTKNFIVEEILNPITNEKEFKLITKTENNYNIYNSWKRHALNGEKVEYLKDGTILTTYFPYEKAQGMVQCFEQGGVTTNEVNYGEYVIIDTIDKNNPENGKVYRRGLNYQYNPIDNPLAGAEYIGQIVGPEGNTAEISVDNFDFITEQGGPKNQIYNMNNGGIIKGVQKFVYDDNGKINEDASVFNDNIKYTWVTIKDDFGIITNCKIGFVFPSLELNLTASPVSAYETKNLTTRTDSGTHPYFSQWHISVPKGIKGNSVDNFKIEKSVAKANTFYYTDINCNNTPVKLLEDTQIYFDAYTEENKISNPININGNIYYVKKEDCYKDVIIYKESNYDNSEEGEYKYISLGEHTIRWIDDIWIENTGTEKDDANIGQEGDGDQRIHIAYNNDPEEHKIGSPINYIVEALVTHDNNDSELKKETNLAAEGHLLVLYSDPEYRNTLQTQGLCKTWRSKKLLDENGKGIIRNDWYDMGYIRGPQGSIKILGNLTPEEQEITLISGNSPEVITKNPDNVGCAFTVGEEKDEDKKIWIYDYAKEKWFIIGTVFDYDNDEVAIKITDIYLDDDLEKTFDEDYNELKDKVKTNTENIGDLTDKVKTNTEDITSLSTSVGNLETNKAPTSHASENSIYGLGSSTLYGHVKVINNLTQTNYADGTALSANQGKILDDKISNCVKNDDARLTNARTPVAHASVNGTYGLGSSTLYGHVKVIDTFDDNAASDSSAVMSYNLSKKMQENITESVEKNLEPRITAIEKQLGGLTFSVNEDGILEITY